MSVLYCLQKCSIEAAVFRFEYALKRITELELQLSDCSAVNLPASNACCKSKGYMQMAAIVGDSYGFSGNNNYTDQMTLLATQQLKYQTYLGLSRCERKRKVNNAIWLTWEIAIPKKSMLIQSEKFPNFPLRLLQFYKRALEFAHMSILVDSTSYEGYYSKAHILKDLG